VHLITPPVSVNHITGYYPRFPWSSRRLDNTFLGSQVGQGTFEAGIYSYSILPLPGAQVFENTTDVTSYSYNPRTREFVSYDTPRIASLKAQYVQARGFAGTMFWDVRIWILRNEEIAEYPGVSCPRTRRGPPRLLVRPLLYMVASIRHQ
jgi:Glycosyl hydrolases family 18